MNTIPSPFCKKKFAETTREEKITTIAGHIEAILHIFGCDLSHNSLKDTPKRVAKMYVDDVFAGFNEKNFPKISLFKAPTPDGKETFVTTTVRFFSFCEHHLVPMFGIASIGYIPKETIIGLSKISRIVRFFAAQPQLQERLTAQIATCLRQILDTDNIIVHITAFHTCVMARGAKDENSYTSTTYALGRFEKEPLLRLEFLSVAETERKIAKNSLYPI